MTEVDHSLVPAPEGLKLLRITGAATVVGATVLLLVEAGLVTRENAPAPFVWMQFVVPATLVLVGVSFLSIKPAAGRLRRRVAQQSLLYKVCMCGVLAGFVAVVVTALVYAP